MAVFFSSSSSLRPGYVAAAKAAAVPVSYLALLLLLLMVAKSAIDWQNGEVSFEEWLWSTKGGYLHISHIPDVGL